jgi:hypothetical protein
MVMAMVPKEAEAAAPPNPEAFAAMQKYNEEAAKAGVLLAAEGLNAPSQTIRVKFSGDERIVMDGPYAEAKEVVAGFMILQVKSKEEVIEWVKRAPNGSATGEGMVEIRKLLDVEDFQDMLVDKFTPNEEVAKVKY